MYIIICPVHSKYNEDCEVIFNRRTNYTPTRDSGYNLQDNNHARIHGESTVVLSCDTKCNNEGNHYFEAIQFSISNTQYCEFNKTVSMVTKRNLIKGYDFYIERDKYVPVNAARDWARCFNPHYTFVGEALDILNQFQIYNPIGFTLHTKNEKHTLVIFIQTGEVLFRHAISLIPSGTKIWIFKNFRKSAWLVAALICKYSDKFAR